VADLARDRRGAVGLLFGLLAPVLVLVVALGIDATGRTRDALHLQGLADRVATSAGPLWAAGAQQQAVAVAAALVAADGSDARLDHAGPVEGGAADALEIIVSHPEQHVLAGLFAPGRQRARAVAVKTRRVG
jgi:uncharacterized membrane protein